MFKKSEEQEWSRFRGALAKEREEAAPAEHPEPGPTGPASAVMPQPSSAAPGTSPSARSSAGDVNVTVPARGSRSMAGADLYEVESLIGERTTFEGTLKSDGAVRVLGSVQGELQCKGAVFVEDKAQVTARISASQVTVAGKVDGQIHCPGRVEIRPTGRVTGEIQAGALIVQEGAFFEGNSKMAAAPGTSPAGD